MEYSQSESTSNRAGIAGRLAEHGGESPGQPGHGHDLVWITIGQEQFQVRRGVHTVAELKRIASVPECDELAEVKDGRIHVLPDGGSTHIEGDEKFLSSPRSCPSS